MFERFEKEADRLDKALEYFDINALNVYRYGSRVYCTYGPDSDFDYIVVTKNVTVDQTLTHECTNLTVYSIADFQQLLDDQEISAIECISLKSVGDIPYFNHHFKYKLNKSKLRQSISAKASNSWVKAKKKFTIENEPYIAKKSLFHSLRIPLFGQQIAQNNRVYNFYCANYLWDDIRCNPSVDWEEYKKIYQPIFNKFNSDFRKLAPK